ncbi:hypothetical protein OSB04_030241 [Centaurea solstitialis]|uniref:non-specific serine/threonine protein kinase n=1 Tax=Centaurea solstitialis TaxID=347529 RepID=A0AA38S824_9ASTR|nr:hypothetical protein OSB04_030241 [Centaurea solstitialis]
MSSEEFHHLKVHLEDVILATNNFDPEKLIGRGGFGPVYKGELFLPQGRTMMAFKRLDTKFGQGSIEFWKEIVMLSKYRHENLVSLLCYCDEGNEKILGYEFVSRGSLDRYLSDSSLTWTQRIRICIGVARALNYLHDPKGTQERVLHRDIKSSNILIDEEWNAKVSDFGLSKLGPANHPESYVYSRFVGTLGYCDPLYLELGFLTKESDVYSFGVVLFEVMCGRVCYGSRGGEQNGHFVNRWKNRYDENCLDDIVCCNLKRHIERRSLMIFSAIASRCLNSNRKERPKMSEIVKELEVALEVQIYREDNSYLVELGNLVQPPLSYRSIEELLLLLSEGFLYNDRRLSVNKNRRVYEMISATECITANKKGGFVALRTENSRFPNVLGSLMCSGFKVKGRTQFLSPHVTYIVSLVFKHNDMDHETHVPFKYKVDNEIHYSTSCLTLERGDGWLMTQLYRFISSQKEHDFEIKLLLPNKSLFIRYYFEGIEFKPKLMEDVAMKIEKNIKGHKQRSRRVPYSFNPPNPPNRLSNQHFARLACGFRDGHPTRIMREPSVNRDRDRPRPGPARPKPGYSPSSPAGLAQFNDDDDNFTVKAGNLRHEPETRPEPNPKRVDTNLIRN